MLKQKNKKKRIVLTASAAIIVLLIAIGRNKGPQGIGVTVTSPQIGTVVETIPANGKIQPVTEVKISPDVSGEIIRLNFQEGDAVTKGDLIIQIKQDVYLSARDRAEASLNAIKAQYLQQEAQFRQIELTHKRNVSLYGKRTISLADYEKSQAEYDIAKSQLKAAEFNVRSAEASLKEAEENLVKTNIYAPMTGTISKLNVEIGERVVGTSQMAGTEMLRIADLNRMEVLVDVNEIDIIRLSAGDTATIEIDAYPNRRFAGVVTQVANSSKNSGTTMAADQVTNFEVKVNILPQSYKDLLEKGNIPLRPGMSASVSIQTARREGVIKIPLQAITTRKVMSDSLDTDDGVIQKVFIYDSQSGKVKAHRVETGIQDMNCIEVTKGLDTSARVVTAPYNAISKELNDGSSVTVNNQ
ncbi:MAG: efflux RND transporter periplasmic adaptor subunit [Bacteroidales bacterium]|nr:efflux RND transporter periplasmic adaptor subunit [Bacteroidales bacterium]